MKKLVRIAAAAAVLGGAGAPAFADLVLPSTGNSTAALTIWDTVNQRSMVVSLTANFNDLLPSLLATSSGANIANLIAASDRAEVGAFIGANPTGYSWWVSAADSAGLGSFGGRQAMTTGTLGLAATSISITNQGVTQAVGTQSANTFYTDVNTVCGADDTCFSDSGTLAYAGRTLWQERWGGNLPPALGNGAAIGEAQGFYLFSTPESATATSFGTPARTAYANAAGFGAFNLIVSGGSAILSYTLNPEQAPVPLPAAAWLLISGLLGFATVARRQKTAAA